MKCDMGGDMEDKVLDDSWAPLRALTQREAVRNMAEVIIEPANPGWNPEQSVQRLKT